MIAAEERFIDPVDEILASFSTVVVLTLPLLQYPWWIFVLFSSRILSMAYAAAATFECAGHGSQETPRAVTTFH